MDEGATYKLFIINLAASGSADGGGGGGAAITRDNDESCEQHWKEGCLNVWVSWL